MSKHAESPLKTFSHSFQVSTAVLLQSSPSQEATEKISEIEEEKYSACNIHHSHLLKNNYLNLFNYPATLADFQGKHDKMLKITEEEYASLFPNYQKEILQWATNDFTKYSGRICQHVYH